MSCTNCLARRLLLLMVVCLFAAPPAAGLAAPPTNDDFVNAEVLNGIPAPTTGTNVEATKETEEPDHAGNAGGNSVWYRWSAPASGSVTLETCDSNFDTLLAVYTGTSVSGLSPIASNDDVPACGLQSRVTFNASSGQVYRIAVDGFLGATGDIALDLFEGAPPTMQCSDGIDNDGDGLIDFPADPGCASTSDDEEANPLPPPPSPPGGGGGVGGGSAPPPSPLPSLPTSGKKPTLPRAVSVSLARKGNLGAVLAEGLKVAVACPAACSISTTLLLNGRTAQSVRLAALPLVAVGSGSKRLASGGRTQVVAKLTARAKRRLKAARQITLTVRTKVRLRGTQRTVERKIKLKRPRTHKPTPKPQPQPNQSPVFPTQTVQVKIQRQFSIILGVPVLTGQTEETTISPGASDPDGDPLTYSWSASNGSITGSGLTGTWTRVVTSGALQPGTVTVTASDGKGGVGTYRIER